MYIHAKKQFSKDLRILLENYEAKQQDMILTGDFNEKVGDNYNEFTQLMLDIEFTDVHSYKHGFDYNIVTWDCGSNVLIISSLTLD